MTHVITGVERAHHDEIGDHSTEPRAQAALAQ